jgi:cellobiose-specific phosphotransferase system component IIA
MRDIYRLAVDVIAWLGGDAKSNAAAALNAIKNLDDTKVDRSF